MALLKVIVGVLVALAENRTVLFVLNNPKEGAPGNRLVIESMSFGWLALENKGEMEINWLVVLLAV